MRTGQLTSLAEAGLLLSGLGAGAGSGTAPPSGSDSTTSIPLTFESLAGIWYQETERPPGREEQAVHGLLMVLGADGTIAFDNGGYLDTQPFVAGTYQIDGDVVMWDVRQGGCSVGPDFRAVIPEDGRLHVVFTETGDGACDVGVGAEWTWIRVSPSSSAGAAINAPVSDLDNAYPPTEGAVPGIWLRQGSGQLLRLSSAGTYAVDDGGLLGTDPNDTGVYEIDGDTITYTSAGSATCTAGDTQMWEGIAIDDVRLHEDHGSYAKTLHTTAGEPDCGAHFAGDQTWLRISP